MAWDANPKASKSVTGLQLNTVCVDMQECGLLLPWSNRSSPKFLRIPKIGWGRRMTLGEEQGEGGEAGGRRRGGPLGPWACT